MKKLRCENCGGELIVDEQEEYATCNYCKTKYKLNEDKTITIKLDDDLKEMYTDSYKTAKKVITPMFIIVPIIMIVIFGAMIFGISKGVSSSGKTDHNSKLEMHKGTQSKFFVNYLLDDIVENNKKSKRIIVVVYNDFNSSNPNEIVNLKQSLPNKSYEVKLEYDSKGYINKVILEDIN